VIQRGRIVRCYDHFESVRGRCVSRPRDVYLLGWAPFLRFGIWVASIRVSGSLFFGRACGEGDSSGWGLNGERVEKLGNRCRNLEFCLPSLNVYCIDVYPKRNSEVVGEKCWTRPIQANLAKRYIRMRYFFSALTSGVELPTQIKPGWGGIQR